MLFHIPHCGAVQLSDFASLYWCSASIYPSLQRLIVVTISGSDIFRNEYPLASWHVSLLIQRASLQISSSGWVSILPKESFCSGLQVKFRASPVLRPRCLLISFRCSAPAFLSPGSRRMYRFCLLILQFSHLQFPCH